MVYGNPICLRKASTSALNGAPPIIISSKFPPKISIAACRAAALILSLTMGTLSNNLPILLSSLGRISFLIIFSTINGTQAITLGLISANDCAMSLGDGIRVKK